MNLIRKLAVVIVLISPMAANAAPTVQSAPCENNADLLCATGILGLDIRGATFDVEFIVDSYDAVYGDMAPMFFGDPLMATLARNAILGAIAWGPIASRYAGPIGDGVIGGDAILVPYLIYSSGTRNVASACVANQTEGGERTGTLEWVGRSCAGGRTEVFSGDKYWAYTRFTKVPEPVTIDIKPGKTPNNVNPTSGQKIPVAVLATDSFDASQVDWETVSFGPDGATEYHGRAHIKDVDDDGDMDLVLHFNTLDTGIACGDTEATLTGETYSGEAITGTDTINTVHCPAVAITTITELVGDKDCFGFGAPCSDGVSVVDPRFGPDGDALVEPSDPFGTDQLGTSVPLGGPSFDFQFDIASFDLIGVTPTSASVTIFTGGIDLGDGPQFLFNGTSIGSYVEAAGQENLAATVVFDVPAYLLTNLNNLTLSFVDQGFIQDGFVIDYVELTVVGSEAASVP